MNNDRNPDLDTALYQQADEGSPPRPRYEVTQAHPLVEDVDDLVVRLSTFCMGLGLKPDVVTPRMLALHLPGGAVFLRISKT